MPLLKGKSQKAFVHNVKTEMKEHPGRRAQNLAIAYSMKRKSKARGGDCYADGGETYPWKGANSSSVGVNAPLPTKETAGWKGNSQSDAGVALRRGKTGLAKKHHEQTISEMRSDKTDRRNLASGGTVRSGDPTMNYAKGGMLTDDGYQSECDADCVNPEHVHEQAEYDSEDYNKKHGMHPDHMAMTEDERMLNQHGEEEEGPTGEYMSGGGMLTDDGYQSTSHEEDMVGRVMAQRQRMFSEGGKVANKNGFRAAEAPDEFDDLALRDDLHSQYTGSNSGDELGNEDEDKRRRDMVNRIMASRRLKDRLPNSAK